MAAITRWVEYPVSAEGVISTGGATVSGLGTRGYVTANSSVGDSFSIGSANNRLYIDLDGDTAAPYVTLASGTDLDPRLVARDIAEKLHATGKVGGYENAQCVWEDNKIKIYSGTLGSSSSVAVSSGTNTAHLELGFGAKTETGGSATANTYVGGLTTSGTYNGFLDETYRVLINKELQLGTPSKGGGNSYLGTITMGGVFKHTVDRSYIISIDITNGSTLGAGTGNVPTMSWTSSGSFDDGGPIELLYADYWYKLGTKGVMVKFTDAVFNTCDPAWTIACTYPLEAVSGNASAPAGTAKYIWSSTRGDDATAALTTSDSAFVRLGTRGVYVKWTGSGNMLAGDEFYVVCKAPQPISYGITTLNYGNVTVSTNSTVKCVVFEIMSGGVEMSTVKFGLQNHGTFSHHDAGNADTEFHFGTVGPGNNAGTSPTDGKEWRTNASASDISSDTPPSYLYASKQDLAVVADADTSESIGASHYMGMVADPIYLGIKLGASEVGANSTINYRLYFDYS